MLKIKRSQKAALALVGVLAVLGLSLGVAGPANALGTKNSTCGNGTYTATSTTTYAQSQQYNQFACGSYHARAKYTYNGNTYYTPFATSATNAVARPGYSTVSSGSHYTDTSGTITT